MAATRLQEFCRFYIQDFDLIFTSATDPVDMFCQQHDGQAQKELLNQMKSFLDGVKSGRKSIRNLVAMGLEYLPSSDENPASWLPQLISYLEAKIADQRAGKPS